MLICNCCLVPLSPEYGDDKCPSCLGNTWGRHWGKMLLHAVSRRPEGWLGLTEALLKIAYLLQQCLHSVSFRVLSATGTHRVMPPALRRDGCVMKPWPLNLIRWLLSLLRIITSSALPLVFGESQGYHTTSGCWENWHSGSTVWVSTLKYTKAGWWWSQASALGCLDPSRNKAYLCHGVVFGPTFLPLGDNGNTLSGWGALWNHKAVRESQQGPSWQLETELDDGSDVLGEVRQTRHQPLCFENINTLSTSPWGAGYTGTPLARLPPTCHLSSSTTHANTE